MVSYLANELPLLIHTDVKARLGALDAHLTSKCVSLHNELCFRNKNKSNS